MKRLTLVLASLVTLLFLVTPVAQAAFPERNITLIVTFSPGGGFDTIARAIARSMKKYLPKGVSVIVKNVTGAGGVTGTVFVYRAKPDGYTIGHIYADGMLGLQMLKGVKKAGYDIHKFTWLALVGGESYGLLLRKDSPYRSVKDLQRAKRVTWGVEGVGVTRWFPAFIAAKELGIPFEVVAGYRGTGESLPALLRGDYDVFTQPIDHPSIVPYLKTGEIRPLVHLSETRAKNAPGVPTAKEVGYDLVVKLSRAIGAPPGVPADRAKILEDLLLKAMADADYKKFVAKSGIALVPGNARKAKKDLEGFATLYGKYKSDMLRAIGK
ncbi:MAG: Bug family tripartite tricarboxylate transporter substrate binding protein [Candidatus Binatia bacterium]